MIRKFHSGGLYREKINTIQYLEKISIGIIWNSGGFKNTNNSMEQSPGDTNSSLSGQTMPLIIWN